MLNRSESATFDPSAVAQSANGIFGLPFTTENAGTIVVPVPWEVTTSYGDGTADGPDAIVAASAQVDLYHPDFPDAWKTGIALSDVSTTWHAQSDRWKPIAKQLIDAQIDGIDIAGDSELSTRQSEVNEACSAVHSELERQVDHWVSLGKKVIVLGGDHSVSLGALRSVGRRYPEFGVLQFDAHMDLRSAYEGFTYSHASIMYNALEIPSLTSLVQVGIRDYCEAELAVVTRENPRIHVVTDHQIKDSQFAGVPWQVQCDGIVEKLPTHVYISFDIDALHPSLCPNTGTPVPGGLQLEEAVYLIKRLIRSGRTVVGIDLVEVSPGADEWDANVGARLLYALFGYWQ
ncbi:agmatinase [bacterium]|nr:agmatinase [bacterium]